MDTPSLWEPRTERIYTASFYSDILPYFAKIAVLITIFHPGGQRFPWSWYFRAEKRELGAELGFFGGGGGGCTRLPPGPGGLNGNE